MKINEAYLGKLKEELSDTLTMVQDLIEDDPVDLPKVKEEVFKTYLLPYMLGLTDKEENDKAFFNNWMNLVGTLNVPFVVVDENDKILFKVPPYLARFDTKKNPVENVSYITIVKEFETKYKSTPDLAIVELKERLKDLSKIFVIDEEYIKEFYEFYSMLRERYNSFYREYKTNLLNSLIKDIDREIESLEKMINTIDLDDKKYKELEYKIRRLKDRRDEIIDEIESLGTDIVSGSINKEDTVEIDYED